MTDYISREAAIAEIMGQPPDAHYPSWYAAQVKKLPAADVRPVVRGKWGKDGDCPVCGCQPWYERDIHTLNFCPNCGADMREDDENG